MKILSIDTSNKVMTIAVSDESSIIAEYSMNSGMTHSETLMPSIERVLNDIKTDIRDIDIFAVSIGPGSFTGLRIGTAAAKALAYANGKKIIGVSSLEALANCVYKEKTAVPILDARNGRVFAGIYRDGKALRKDEAYDLKEFLAGLKSTEEYGGDGYIFTGDGIDAYRDIIIEIMGEAAEFASMKDKYSRASSVCEIALKRVLEGEFDDCMTLAPEYLRPSQAERQKNA